DGVLEDVVGLLPAVDLRVALDHLAREAAQPFAGTVEQLAAGGLFAAAQAVEVGLDLQRLRRRIGHATTPARVKWRQLAPEMIHDREAQGRSNLLRLSPVLWPALPTRPPSRPQVSFGSGVRGRRWGEGRETFGRRGVTGQETATQREPDGVGSR